MPPGVVVWAIAHLLTNSDRPSIVLFGGMAAWALAEIVVIAAAVHAALGYYPLAQ